VNIANLQLARLLSRRAEIATRMAIGASRGRIVRQLLTESVMLTVLGGGLGLLAAAWGSRVLLALAPPIPQGVPIAVDVTPDARVLAFVLLLSVAIGLVFGLATALGPARAGLHPLLSSRAVTPRGGGWLSPRQLLVGGQVALSAVLLVTAFLFLESLANASRIGLGFRPENRLSLAVRPVMVGYTETKARRLHDEARRRVGEVPGVVSASSTLMLPLSGGYLGDGYVWPEGDLEPSDHGRPMVYFDRVGPAYFSTMGATLLEGREFTEQDDQGSRPVAVVNQTFADRFWPGENALGRRFRTGSVSGPLVEIVGVVADGRYNSLGEDPQRHVYQPLAQGAVASGFFLVLHTAGDPRGVAAAARSTVRALDPDVPVTGVQTMTEHLRFVFWGPRVGAMLLGGFALVGVALSAAGLYGVLAFLVNRSVPEIAVRMALGASPASVLVLFLRRGLAMAGAGVVLGLGLSAAAARGVSSHLYTVPAWSPLTFAAVAALLVTVAFVASYLPSRRAVRVDPLRALRQE
jgi:predicted permease